MMGLIVLPNYLGKEKKKEKKKKRVGTAKSYTENIEKIKLAYVYGVTRKYLGNAYAFMSFPGKAKSGDFCISFIMNIVT